tara:strand:+ start:522 stop:800 length:279 start_codon:yes stop_codon:yes gene_type:complete
MIQTKKKKKKKIKIDGLTYKIDYNVDKAIEALQDQLSNHTLALYTYIEIYNSIDTPTEIETILYNYAMQLPLASTVEEEVKNPEEDESEDND